MIFSILINSAVLIILILHNVINKKDFFRPFNLITLSLVTTLLISSFKLSSLQHNFSLYFICLIYSAIFFFWIGTKISIRKNSNVKKQTNINPRRFRIVVNLLFILIVIAYMITVYKLGAPPLFSGADRVTYYISGIESILMLSYLLIYLVIYDLLTNRFISKNKSIIFMLIVVFILITKMNKMSLLFLAFEPIFLIHFLKKKIKAKQVILFIAVTLLLFILAYTYFYSGYYNIDIEARIIANGFKFSGFLGHLVDPYMYIVCNYENLQNYIMHSGQPHSYGYGMITPFLEIFNAGKILSFGTTVQASWTNSLQYPWLTTGTIFREIFHDFSYIGFIFVPMFLGVIGEYSYKSFSKYRDPLSGLFYLVISFGLMLSFFTNIFWQKIYVVNILVGSIVIFYIKRNDAISINKTNDKSSKKRF